MAMLHEKHNNLISKPMKSAKIEIVLKKRLFNQDKKCYVICELKIC